MDTQKKRGRGRPKLTDDPFVGRSIVEVKLKDLVDQFDGEQMIPVGMPWYRSHKKVVHNKPQEEQKEEVNIAMKISE